MYIYIYMFIHLFIYLFIYLCTFIFIEFFMFVFSSAFFCDVFDFFLMFVSYDFFDFSAIPMAVRL